MEVPRLGVKSELQLLTYATAKQHRIWAASVTYTTAHSNAWSLTHWAKTGINPTSSWILVRFINAEPEGIRGGWAELRMVPALTVSRCWAYKGSVVGLRGWSSWPELVAQTTKKEERKVKGGVGGRVPWQRAVNPCGWLIYAGSSLQQAIVSCCPTWASTVLEMA